MLQRKAFPALVVQPLQIVRRIEARHAARRIECLVPEPRFKAACVEYDRALARCRFKTVRIELGLLLADAGALAGALGLHHRQRFAVYAIKHVIREAITRAEWHALERLFDIVVLLEYPPGFFEVEVDIAPARFELTHVLNCIRFIFSSIVDAL